MKYYAITEKGKRNRNEDYHITKKIDDYYVFCIADGVGGLSDGDIASKIAIDTITKEIKNKGKIGFRDGIEKANSSILCKNEKNQQMMATTLLACLIKEETNEAIIAHVGDSRAYVINTNIWKTKDHTLVQDLVDLEIITENEALTHPEKHRMNRAIGIIKNVEIEIDKKMLKDSILLLCSDGLSSYVNDNKIATIVKQYDPKNACKRLVQVALENGSQDNITIIVANIG